MVNDTLVTYLYQKSDIKVANSGVVSRRQEDRAVARRKFGIKLSLDSRDSTYKRKVKVWLSESSNPNDVDERLEWNMQTNSTYKVYDSKNKCYTINDAGSVVTYTCPKDVTYNYLDEQGSKKLYIHVMTETGNTAYVSIDLVKRLIYQQH